MRFLSVLLVSSIAVGCNDAATEVEVEVEAPLANVVQATPESRFTPSTALVRVGGTITWNFGALAHSVIFQTATGRPENIQQPVANSTETRTFTTAGLFRYECGVHPTMVGEIDVRPAPSE